MTLGARCIACSLFLPRAAFAGVIVTLEQVGSDVVGLAGGTLDLNDLTGPVASFGPGPAQPVGGEFVIGGSGVDYYFLPSDFTGPTSFGAGGFTSATSSIADSFGATLANTTLADLGVDAGIYTWAWTGDPDADSFSVFAGIEPPSSGAPEPASMFLIAAGLDTLTAAARKRTRAT